MITIFTPTYNRVDLIKKLAFCLEKQTNNNFIWLIIDDGSSDQTENWLNEYAKNSRVKIKYIKQKNQGKHVAFNTAIGNCFNEILVNVDSDDTLTENAIDIIYEMIKGIDENAIGCVCGKKIGKVYNEHLWEFIDGKLVDIIDLKELYGITESTIVFKTDVLKNYNFPVFYDKHGQQEKFVPEGFLYNQLISAGKFTAFKKVFYHAEYQKSGLTRNLFKKTWINNFNGVIAMLNLKYSVVSQKYDGLKKIKAKIKIIMNINALCLKKNEDVLSNTPSIFMSILFFIPSIFFKVMRFGI